MRTLSSDGSKGKVFRNVRYSAERVVLPEPRLPVRETQEDEFEGGRQIDPYLVAGAKIQDLQRRIDRLLEEKRVLQEELDSLRSGLDEERTRLEARERELNDRLKTETDRAREKARNEGFDRGYDEGLEAARAKAREEITVEFAERFGRLEKLLETTLDTLEASRREEIDRHAPLLIGLWRKMLERLLRREVELDGQTVLRVFRELIHRVSDRTKIRIVLNPADRELFLKNGAEYAEIKRAADSFEVVADEHIEKGSCVLETGLGVYDARWESQLERIDREIDGILREALVHGTPGV
ncbi:MAG: FliH/SctL family protein [Thermovirgaceae bacterium]